MEALQNIPQTIPLSSIANPLDTLFSMGFRPKYTELISHQPWHITGSAEVPAGFHKINDETMMLLSYDRYGAKTNLKFFKIPTYNNIMSYTDEEKTSVTGQNLWQLLNNQKQEKKNKMKFFTKSFIHSYSDEYVKAVQNELVLPTPYRYDNNPAEAENVQQQQNLKNQNQRNSPSAQLYRYVKQKKARRHRKAANAALSKSNAAKDSNKNSVNKSEQAYSTFQQNLDFLAKEKVYVNSNSEKVHNIINELTRTQAKPEPSNASLKNTKGFSKKSERLYKELNQVI